MKNACYNPRVSQLSLISSNTVCVIPVRLSNLCGFKAPGRWSLKSQC